MEALLQEFALPAAADQVEPLAGGHIHLSWKVTLRDESQWVLQRVNASVFPHLSVLAHNVERVVAHLHRAHDAPLWLQPTQAGRGHLAAEGTLWRLWPYVPGRSLAQADRPEQAEAAGRAFGRFARQVADLNTNTWRPSLPRFHDLDWRLDQLQAAEKQATPHRLGEARDALARIAHAATQRKDLRPYLSQLPQRLAHCDAKVANLRLHPTRDEALTVLDFDTVMLGTPLFDLGDLIRSLSSPAPEDGSDLTRVQVRPAYVRALLSGYLAEAHLSPLAQRLIPAAGSHLMLIMAVRFLVDYLAGDRYYPITHARHNLARSLNQLALLDAWQARNDGA